MADDGSGEDQFTATSQQSLSSIQFALYVTILLMPLYFKQIKSGIKVIHESSLRHFESAINSKRLLFIGVTGLALIMSQWGPDQFDKRSELEVSYLDVGQGDGTLIRTPSGKVILIDTGLEKGKLLVEESLLKLGIDQIDLIILSHPHADHIGGAKMILENLKVKKLAYFKGHYAPEEELALKELFSIGEENGTEVGSLVKGDLINFEPNISLEVLHPDVDFDSKSANDESVVIQMVYGETNFLFTGDISSQVECDIIGKVHPGKTVLKVPHHGSATSNGDALTGLESLVMAVIQVGENNRYGHPKASALDRYRANDVPVLRNDQNGCVQIFSNGKQLWYKVQIQED